ncbi:hypothetical protein ANTPLA_LOCUS641 [Anthophora plagiata]
MSVINSYFGVTDIQSIVVNISSSRNHWYEHIRDIPERGRKHRIEFARTALFRVSLGTTDVKLNIINNNNKTNVINVLIINKNNIIIITIIEATPSDPLTSLLTIISQFETLLIHMF